MKLPNNKYLAAALLAATTALPCSASGFDITDLLPPISRTDSTASDGKKGSGLSGIVGGVLGNLLGNRQLTITDLCGEWKATGPAVSFSTDNLLARAGGAAGAAVLEGKIRPYYDKLGMENATFTVYPDSTFALRNRQLTLKGNIESPAPGQFVFRFSAAGLFNIGAANVYLERQGKNLKVMFDVTTLKTIISKLAILSGSGLAKTASRLLDEYDGMCAGFAAKKVADVKADDTAFPAFSSKKKTDNAKKQKKSKKK